MPEIIVKLGDNIVHKYIFDKEIMSVGRARDNDVVIENLSVSRNHARVRKEGDRYILTDLNSANGTYVNGVRVTRVEIVNDDVITIGKHKLHFIDKEQSDEEIIGEAFGAERTMLVDRAQSGQLLVTKGKQKDQEFKITKYETYIGRASDNDVRLHDWFVSKKHAVIIRQGNNFFIKDLGSWRGTMVNGKNVRDCELKDGEEIQLGTTVLAFRLEGEAVVPQITGRVPQEIGYEESEAEPAAMGAEPVAEGAAVEAYDGEDYGQSEEEVGQEVAAEAHADDEFAPLSEEELMALEEQDREFGEEESAAAGAYASAQEYEQPAYAGNAAGESAQAEEEQFAESVRTDEGEAQPSAYEAEGSPQEEREEEAALLGEGAGYGDMEAPEGAAYNEAAADAGGDQYAPLPEYQELPSRESDSPAAASEEDLGDEAALWLKALNNKSRVIRREAARKLKHLTGRDYDWESEPE